MTAAESPQRRLFVAWRNPETRQIIPVGLLVQRRDGDAASYSFAYLKLAETLDGFHPLPGLPNLQRRYDSPALFPVFANRLMPRDRADYPDYLSRLDLDVDADPFEVLGRSNGTRATDRIEVFAAPERTTDDHAMSLFFVRGIRHLDGAPEAVDRLHDGQVLAIVDDPDNVMNGRALLLAGDDREPVGWVPDYLVEHLHELRQYNGADPTVIVEHVNGPDAAPHMRVLCRVTAPWPVGYEPFHSIEFQPVISLEEPTMGPNSATDPASERLPDLLPDPVEVGGTARYDAGQRIAQIPCGTRGNGTQQDRPERTWNDRRSRPPNGVSMVGAWT